MEIFENIDSGSLEELGRVRLRERAHTATKLTLSGVSLEIYEKEGAKLLWGWLILMK